MLLNSSVKQRHRGECLGCLEGPDLQKEKQGRAMLISVSAVLSL